MVKGVLIGMVPIVIFFGVAFLFYQWKKRVDKQTTGRVTGTVLSNRSYKAGKNNGKVSLIEYTLDGKSYQKEFQVNQLIYLGKVPIGQKKGLPVGVSIELRYNPENTQQIFSVVDNQFGKRFGIGVFSFLAILAIVVPILILLHEIGVLR